MVNVVKSDYKKNKSLNRISEVEKNSRKPSAPPASSLDDHAFAVSDFVSLVFFIFKQRTPDELNGLKPKVEYNHGRWHELNVTRFRSVISDSLLVEDGVGFSPLLSDLDVTQSVVRITKIISLILENLPANDDISDLLHEHRECLWSKDSEINSSSLEYWQLTSLFTSGLSTPALAFVFGDLFKLPIDADCGLVMSRLAASLRRRHQITVVTEAEPGPC